MSEHDQHETTKVAAAIAKEVNKSQGQVDVSYHEPNATEKEMKSELIYGLNDRPPVKDALFAAIQHLLAIFVAIITPPLIIAGALNFDIETTSYLPLEFLLSFNAVVLALLAAACYVSKVHLSPSLPLLLQLVPLVACL